MSLTNIYIDGFNLYYLAVKGTPYKWLDLSKLSQQLVPAHQINQIRYFTALVQPRPYDHQVHRRQLVYIRALETISNLTIHYGKFRTHPKRLMPTIAIPGITGTVEVWNTEEKGTDVNLASHLLLDGFRQSYEQAVVISNDSDLALAIKMVRDDLGIPVGLVNPNVDPESVTPRVLTASATFTRKLRTSALENNQFPDQIEDSQGIITKPSTW